MKTLIVLLAALALAPAAQAGLEAHVFVQVDEESHTLDVVAADDGTATVLVDGAPPAAPAPPTLP